MSHSRGTIAASPRDNVLLELGLFLGVLGRRRTFIVHDRKVDIKLPTDLAGVTLASYELHSTGNLVSSLGACCTQFEGAIKELGQRPRSQPGFEINQSTQFQIISDLLDDVARQVFILMKEQNVILRREAMFGNGIQYTYYHATRSRGNGSFGVVALRV